MGIRSTDPLLIHHIPLANKIEQEAAQWLARSKQFDERAVAAVGFGGIKGLSCSGRDDKTLPPTPVSSRRH